MSIKITPQLGGEALEIQTQTVINCYDQQLLQETHDVTQEMFECDMPLVFGLIPEIRPKRGLIINLTSIQ